MGLGLGIVEHWRGPQAVTYKKAGAPAGKIIKQQNTNRFPSSLSPLFIFLPNP